jgi:hypothetical protein
MELNKLNLFAQNAAAVNKAQGKEEAKAEEKAAAEVKDNKPAEKQCSADDVFAYMAGTTVDFKAKVAKAGKADGQEDRIAGFMSEFEEAFAAAKELGLSDEAAIKVLERM